MTRPRYRRTVVKGLLLSAIIVLAAQPAETQHKSQSDSPRIRALAAAVASGRTAAVDAFWKAVERDGAPLIEAAPGHPDQALVTFLFRGDGTTRNVALFRGPEVSLDLGKNQLERLDGTNVWYRSYLVGRDARFTYMIGANVDPSQLDERNPADVARKLAPFKLDPLNPKRFPADGSGVPSIYINSVVELPDAPPQPWVVKRPGVPAGKVEAFTLASTLLHNERTVSVYTPAGYPEPGGGPYHLLILFDREAYLSLVPTPTILDNLIADHRIPPLVAVLVSNPPNARGTELHCSRSFSDFLATELVPWVEARYRIANDPSRITIAGSSAGGLASTCAAFFHPERFGTVLSQSGAYWWGMETPDHRPEWITRQIEASPKRPIRFYLDVGLLENSHIADEPTMIDVNRHLRDVLRAKGYDVHYAEVDGGHEHLSWQGTLADGLIALLGGSAR